MFQLLTVLYGESPFSFLATRCLKELAKIYEDKYPKEAIILSKDFYMDDILTGANSIEKVMTIKTNLTKLLKLGCMELSKWCTNFPELLQSISKQEQKPQHRLGESNSGINTLGLVWDPIPDVLRCQW